MQISMNKTKLSAIIVIVLMVTSITLLALPVQAQEEGHGGYTEGLPGGSIPLPAGLTPDYSYPSLSHISFRPNPIGVGQPMLVNLFTQPPIHVARYFKDAFLVTFTKPDGSTDTVGPMGSYYGDGTNWFEYVVDQVGNWTIKFDFLGAYFPPGNYTSSAAFTFGQTLNAQHGVYYQPSHDGPYDFVVQEELALSWPPSPLPTDYWTRPVSFENREWWPILGAYPSTGIVGYPGVGGYPADTNMYQSNYNFIPYVQAPNTPHIMWMQQKDDGGLIGGTLGQLSLTNAGSGISIIYNGRTYGTISKPGTGTTAVTYWQCFDLRTGELIWERPLATGESAPNMVAYTTRTISAVPGDIASSRNVGADLMYVGGGRLIKYDPWTGAVNLNISIAPLTTGTFYANGESAPLFYTVQNLGNSVPADQRYRLINWTVIGDIGYPDVTNKRLGVISNISWPFSSMGTVDYEAGIAVITQGITPDSTGVSYGQMLMGVSMLTGNLLWNVSTDVSVGYDGFFSGSTAIADHGKYAVRLNDGKWHCWDLQTGHELWQSEWSSTPWGIWGIYGVESAYGLLYYPQYDGVVAYNWTNGKIVWRYKYIAPYPYETVYSDSNTGEALYPFYDSVVRIADGKIYTSNTEHTASQPATRGWKLHCINATTGEGIWNITGSMAAGGVADGYLTANDRNNGIQYVFGKGISATTVMAPDVSVPLGTSLVIKGTVLDQSPAQPGTPCVSAASMATQMEYLHMQMPIDGMYHNLTISGVPVVLTAIGSDGSFVDLGTVTTDGYYGTFSKTWAPPKEVDYKIVAQFAGDDSYGSSSAGTSLSVGPATPTPETPEIPTPADYSMLLYGILVAVIIAIVLALVALFWKR
jgi:outer membrane protein assembly factor BamB